MSWRDVADFVAPDAPELSEALNALELDTPVDALALAGSPGQTIWGLYLCIFNISHPHIELTFFFHFVF
jgi:hypothetical protein